MALLKGRKVASRGSGGVVSQADTDHGVNALGKGCGVLNVEPALDKGRLEKKGCDVLDIEVLCVVVELRGEILDDAAVGVKLQGLLSGHHAAQSVVSQRLVLHDLAHRGSPAPLCGDEDARGVYKAITPDADSLDLIAKDLLHVLAELCEALLLLLLLLLLVFRELKVDAVLGYALQLLTLKLLERGGHILVDGLVHKQNLYALLVKPLEERRLLQVLERVACDVVDRLLVFGHAGDVIVEGRALVLGLCTVVAQKLGELATVLAVLVDTELDGLSKLLEERLILVLVILEVLEELESLVDEVLADCVDDAILLEHLTGDVQRKIVAVDHALEEREPVGNNICTFVCDKPAC